jgi:hypothetical protein
MTTRAIIATVFSEALKCSRKRILISLSKLDADMQMMLDDDIEPSEARERIREFRQNMPHLRHWLRKLGRGEGGLLFDLADPSGC